MSVIYKYNYYGELVDFNTNFIELDKNSCLYINESELYYNTFNHMKHLKKISYDDLQNFEDKVIIYHSQ